jgi:hypothetical protein
MMAATRSNRRKTGRLPEDHNVSKVKQVIEKIKNKRNEPGAKELENRERGEEPMVEDSMEGTEEALNGIVGVGELPYADIEPLPVISRTQRVEKTKARQEGEAGVKDTTGALSVENQWKKDGNREKDQSEVAEIGFENRAPLQADEKAKILIRDALRNPIHITTEDLLSVSESARQELRKLLTKRRVERQGVAFVTEVNNSSIDDATIKVESLPGVSYEILEQDTRGMPKGAIIIGDPVVQYLSTLPPGEKPRKVVVANESQGLRAVYPLINGVGEVESLLDGGSQIVSMAKDVAVDLEIPWDPDITVHMQSANRSLEQTLGLAKNVPFIFGHITVYLQVHIITEPAYKVLLGRPFDTITESLVKNEKDGSQNLTLTDPNTGERCVMHTHERGRPPTVLKKPVKEDFR